MAGKTGERRDGGAAPRTRKESLQVAGSGTERTKTEDVMSGYSRSCGSCGSGVNVNAQGFCAHCAAAMTDVGTKDPIDALLDLAQKWVENWRSTDTDTMQDDLDEAGLRIVRECTACDGTGEAVADMIDGYSRYDICERCGGTGIALNQFRILADAGEVQR
jgi:hypothetical protein